MNPIKRAVIYTRVSKDYSGEGKSNQRQEDDCRALARLRQWEVIDAVPDISISAYSGKYRPGWNRVMEMMRNGEVDIVLAWHMDRVTRTVRELTDIIALSRETGVGIATVNGDIDLSNDTGKMVATILGAVAEQEVERKGARQKAANAQRRAEGKRWASGWRPFGYELDGTVVKQEAALIEQAATDVLTGTPIREIARRWRESGISTPRSDKGAEGWTHHGVKSILLNPRNAGLNTYKGEIIGQGDWIPILSETTHVQLVARLTDPARNSRGSVGRPAANLLSGIAICDRCEEPVTGGTVGRTQLIDGKRVSTGERAPVYKCPNNHLSANREDIDGLIVAAFAMAVKFNIQTARLMPIGADGADSDALVSEAERLNTSLTDLAASFAQGRITLEQMEITTGALQQQLRAVQTEIAKVATGGPNAAEIINSNVHRWLELDTPSRRRILLRLARIRIYPKGRGKRNVPPKHQVTMDLVIQDWVGDERVIPALNERPKDLEAANVVPQKRNRARPINTTVQEPVQ